MAGYSLHKAVGAVLRTLRDECRFTKPELAAALRLHGLDWTPHVIASTESGVRKLLFCEAIVLADYFDVAVADLIGEKRVVFAVADRVALGAGAVRKLLGGSKCR